MRAKLIFRHWPRGVGSAAKLGTAARIGAGFASIRTTPLWRGHCPGRWGTRRDTDVGSQEVRFGARRTREGSSRTRCIVGRLPRGGGRRVRQQQQQQQQRRWRQRAGRSPAPRSSTRRRWTARPRARSTTATGKDTNGAAHQIVAHLQQEVREPGLQGRADRVPGLRRPAARAVHPAPAGQVRRLRRLLSDVIWTAEFASQKWLYDMTPYVDKAKDKYIDAPLETVHYGGKYWGAPASSDAAFIFYRTDKGPASRRRPGRRSTPRPRRAAASSTRARRTRA